MDETHKNTLISSAEHPRLQSGAREVSLWLYEIAMSCEQHRVIAGQIIYARRLELQINGS